MPWVWTDELAELMDQDDAVNAAALRRWRTQPIGLAVPPECDLATLGRQLLGSPHTAPRVALDAAAGSCGPGDGTPSGE
jgi:hypothetical protein